MENLVANTDSKPATSPILQADGRATNSNGKKPYRIAFVLTPRFNMMALSAAVEPLRVANYIRGYDLYEWKFLSADGLTIEPSNGMAISAEDLPEGHSHFDMVLVCASWNAEQYQNDRLFGWLRRIDRHGAILGSLCMGTYVLARAQLMSGYDATIHWHCIHGFSENHPNVEIKEQIYVMDRNRWTSGGGTAGMDMMLSNIKKYHGEKLAYQVSDQILHSPLRESETPQRHALGGKQEILHPVLRKAVTKMESNLEEPISIPIIAEDLGISQRKMERLFKKHMGLSAVGFYRKLRLEFARVLLTHTGLQIRDVAVASGFSSLSHFSKAFILVFGKRPRDYRESWPSNKPTPDWPGMSAPTTEFNNAVQKWRENVDGETPQTEPSPYQ